MKVLHYFALHFLLLGITYAAPFITVWNTSIVDESNTNEPPAGQIKLGLTYGGVYDFTVDWGDDSTDYITTWDQTEITHSYAEDGIYEVRMEGTITGWRQKDAGALKLIEISQWGNLKFKGSNYFENCVNLDITAIDAPDLTDVTDLSYGFQYSGITSANLSAWDMSRVTGLIQFFAHATKFNGDVSTWDVSTVTTFYHTFNDNPEFNSDLSQWDTSSSTDMASMFTSGTAFNSDISQWDVSRVVDFSSALRLCDNFNQNLNEWSVSSATDIKQMFAYSFSFNQDLIDWDVSNVQDMEYMFQANTYNQSLSKWDTSSVLNMKGMFHGVDSFEQDLSNWDTSSVTDMSEMFLYNDAFNHDLGGWDTSSVTDMTKMFENDIFHQDLSGWDTSSLEACANFKNRGCNPPGMIPLGCFDSCCSTQVANSNYASADSLNGEFGVTFEVICDELFTGGGNATCSDVTGQFTDMACAGENSAPIYIYIYIYIYQTTHIPHALPQNYNLSVYQFSSLIYFN